MKRLVLTLAATTALTGLALMAPAAAQDYPKTHLKVVGSISTLPPNKEYESRGPKCCASWGKA
jgi:hypothetical protein